MTPRRNHRKPLPGLEDAKGLILVAGGELAEGEGERGDQVQEEELEETVLLRPVGGAKWGRRWVEVSLPVGVEPRPGSPLSNAIDVVLMAWMEEYGG